MKPLAFLLLCFITFCVHAQEAATLKLLQSIPLPRVNGRFDHFAIDVKGQRLFVAALGNNTLEVVDLEAGKRLQSITGLRKPTGVLYLEEHNQIGVANGEDGTFKLFDGATYELVNSLRGLDDADNVRRDQKTKLIYVGCGDGALAILDRTGRKKLGDIKLPAHPESFQLEPDGPRIFVNVPGAKEISVIDRDKREVIARWHVEKLEANFPMALDTSNQRVFVGCRKPVPWIFPLNSATGGFVQVHSISGDIDDLFYDAKRKRIYTSCGEGFIDVIAQADATHYRTLEKIATRAGARTSFFSSELDRFYLAVPRRDDHNAEIRIYLPN